MEFKTINIDVEAAIWKKVGVFAAANGTTKKDIVNAALISFLNGEKKTADKN